MHVREFHATAGTTNHTVLSGGCACQPVKTLDVHCKQWAIVHISIHPGLQPAMLSTCDSLCADIKSFPCYTHMAYYRKSVFIRDEQYIFYIFF